MLVVTSDGNRTRVEGLENPYSTTELLTCVVAVGFEPTRIAPTDLKPVALTTRPSLWYLLWESNPRPTAYKAGALPLSYEGKQSIWDLNPQPFG